MVDYVTLRARVERGTYAALRRYARGTGRPIADAAGALLDAAACDHDLSGSEDPDPCLDHGDEPGCVDCGDGSSGRNPGVGNHG